MSVEDFFAKIDKKLHENEVKKAIENEKADDNYACLKEAVIRLMPIVLNYESELKKRNIRVELKSGDAYISFNMFYKDGGHHGVILGRCLRSNRIDITGSFTSDDGKNYTSTDGITYSRENWQDSIFEEKLRKCIDDFMFYASRHKGI